LQFGYLLSPISFGWQQVLEFTGYHHLGWILRPPFGFQASDWSGGRGLAHGSWPCRILNEMEMNGQGSNTQTRTHTHIYIHIETYHAYVYIYTVYSVYILKKSMWLPIRQVCVRVTLRYRSSFDVV
jgi:hypothetical protein